MTADTNFIRRPITKDGLVGYDEFDQLMLGYKERHNSTFTTYIGIADVRTKTCPICLQGWEETAVSMRDQCRWQLVDDWAHESCVERYYGFNQRGRFRDAIVQAKLRFRGMTPIPNGYWGDRPTQPWYRAELIEHAAHFILGRRKNVDSIELVADGPDGFGWHEAAAGTHADTFCLSSLVPFADRIAAAGKQVLADGFKRDEPNAYDRDHGASALAEIRRRLGIGPLEPFARVARKVTEVVEGLARVTGERDEERERADAAHADVEQLVAERDRGCVVHLTDRNEAVARATELRTLLDTCRTERNEAERKRDAMASNIDDWIAKSEESDGVLMAACEALDTDGLGVPEAAKRVVKERDSAIRERDILLTEKACLVKSLDHSQAKRIELERERDEARETTEMMRGSVLRITAGRDAARAELARRDVKPENVDTLETLTAAAVPLEWTAAGDFHEWLDGMRRPRLRAIARDWYASQSDELRALFFRVEAFLDRDKSPPATKEKTSCPIVPSESSKCAAYRCGVASCAESSITPPSRSSALVATTGSQNDASSVGASGTSAGPSGGTLTDGPVTKSRVTIPARVDPDALARVAFGSVNLSRGWDDVGPFELAQYRAIASAVAEAVRAECEPESELERDRDAWAARSVADTIARDAAVARAEKAEADRDEWRDRLVANEQVLMDAATALDTDGIGVPDAAKRVMAHNSRLRAKVNRLLRRLAKVRDACEPVIDRALYADAAPRDDDDEHAVPMTAGECRAIRDALKRGSR